MLATQAPRDSATEGTPSLTPALLELRDVTIRFGGILALNGVSFQIAPGEICGLIGPNGAGKTTLLNCLSRLYIPDEGGIRFSGRSLTNASRHEIAQLGMARTFQNLALFRSMTVFENVMVGCHATGRHGFLRHAFGTKAAREEEALAADLARHLLGFLQLQEVANTRVCDLPFGTQKRVELARGLVSGPKLILLDEPAAGLNHAEVESLGDVIREIRDRLGTTVMLIEHHMKLIMRVSDHLVVLNFGSVIGDGAPTEIAGHADVINAYLGTKA